MTDSEKLDLILEKVVNLEKDINNTNERIDNLETQMKQTERVLKNEIRKECSLVLDEVERVHNILDKHKADKSVHTA